MTAHPPPVKEQLRGLSTAEVLEQRRRFGENVLPTTRGPTAWSILVDQFKSPLIYIILIAAAISLVAGQRVDFVIIMAVVAIDVAVGFIQEYRAQRTYSALRGLLKPTTTVIRDGTRQEVEIREVVPGDLVVLSAGERIPADGDVVEGARLAVDEAILTGEAEAVAKGTAPPTNKAYMGTTVVAGRGLMRVTQTGSAGELGRIAMRVSESPEEETPLRRRLRRFSRGLSLLVAAVTAIILATGLLSGRPLLETIRVSIVLAIAAIPESLLIAVTIILVLGMQAILARNGLVRKLSAVETLGSVTVICTDKTGTLTEGRLRVTRSDLADREQALQTMVLCNNREGSLELALWEFASAQLGADAQALVERSERLDEEPFSSETKYMAVAARLDGQARDHIKGAPEVVLRMCRIDEARRAEILAEADRWASEGLKPFGLASRSARRLAERTGYAWAGLVAMEDPIREGVNEAVALTRNAGIKVKMITGDYRRTAERIAATIGLAEGAGQVMEGQELEALDDAALQARVEDVAIFSRIRPEDKLRIVAALQTHDEVVAMIGDGVNDAPALQRANIGVVVGTGTDVAKETGDLILLDNNFRTVVLAVQEGRIIFENIRKVVSYTMSNSFAEVLAIFAAQLLGFPPLLTVVQILWIHLIADGPPDIVLGFERQEPGIMEEKPKPLSEPVLPPLGLGLAVAISVVSAAFALVLFANLYLLQGNLVLGQSLAFAIFAIDAMIYIFGYRSLRCSLGRVGAIGRNMPLVGAVVLGLALAIGAVVVPPLRRGLGLASLSVLQWALILAFSFALLGLVEAAKYIDARLRARRGGDTNCG
ncbi:MAG TPA: cation-transporting P-type ATPase [Anaerolineae bacterium]|nr:cation-transporting P-type ATPase [Anaerolineae bacterium]HOQ99324.1 cation-transporting P-type ATPase [Anaerolineae bacterium]HPL27670.1 cation-transporting P-type ATPase [Anaerolineae bacterium]